MARRDQHRELRRSRALEAIGFWILTLIVCAVAGAICHRLGKAYLAEGSSHRTAKAPAGARPEGPGGTGESASPSGTTQEEKPVIEVQAQGTAPTEDRWARPEDKGNQSDRDSTGAEPTPDRSSPAEREAKATGEAAEPKASTPERTPRREQERPAPDRPAPVKPAEGRYVVRAGSFTNQANAQRAAATLRERGYLPQVVSFTKDGKAYNRVTVGSYATEDEASEVRDLLRQEGFADTQVTRE